MDVIVDVSGNEFISWMPSIPKPPLRITPGVEGSGIGAPFA